MFVVSRPTALRVCGLGFTAWGLRAESDMSFADPRLRADRSTATLRFARNKGGRMIRRRMQAPWSVVHGTRRFSGS